MAGILSSGRAPAYAQTQTMHWLRWADFVPASDTLLKGEIAQECQKALGMELKVETINANDIQSRITSAIQSGTGPDIFMTLNNWPQLYADSLSDVEDVADELAKAQGGFRHGRRQVDRGAVVRRRYTRRLSQVMAGRGWIRRQVPSNMG
jgi:multiple sugar transport system substrate-binding protein